MNPKIVSIDLTPIHVPFRKETREVMESGEGSLGMAIPSEEPWTGADFVICRITTSDGSIGVADVLLWLPEDGLLPENVINSVEKGFGKYFLGENPFNIRRIHDRLDRNVARNEIEKGLLENACYDLMGKIINRPACDLMGGKSVDRIPLAVLVPLTDLNTMVTYAKFFYNSGYKSFRYKLGSNIIEDVEISKTLREVFGPKVRLRVDYNQAYRPAEAVQAIKSIEPYDIDYAEQPVSKNDFLGMAYVQKRVDTPLMAHESFFSLNDFATLVELRAVGVLGINCGRPGGIINSLKAIDYAEQRGLGVVVHDQSLGISAAMLIHLVAAKYHSINHDTELFGHMMLEDDLIVKKLEFKKGMVKVPEGPGWGVQLDEEALEKYATGPTIFLE
ncbi:MAG: mandelate racemase/muconate lactonizing enzyme family protein [Candidatus Helarchaeota archaeon]|nr:mandelate racemase/muconate lactonizing enzyme family protein [Candidatus Helarchaeota archaeon]